MLPVVLFVFDSRCSRNFCRLQYISVTEIESIMSDLTMANVEALAGSEINDEDCVSASNRYCSVLIVTPNGNYLETYFDQKTKY